MYEVETLGELVRAVRDQVTGGYSIDFTIRPNEEQSRCGEGFFLVIDVQDSDPNSMLSGQWWFFDNDTVMQVL